MRGTLKRLIILAALMTPAWACSHTRSDRASERDEETNAIVVRRFLGLIDRHQLDSLDQVLAPGFQLHLGASSLDRKQTEDMIKMFLAGFPDFRHDVEEVLALGDRVVLRATDRATHTGEFQGIRPTGRAVTFGQIAIYRMAGGKIAEIWEEADVAGLMQQLTSRPSAQ